MQEHQKAIRIGSIAIIAISIIVAIIYGLILPAIKRNAQPAMLSLNLAPAIARAELNGQELSSGIYELAPGHYSATLKIAKEHKQNANSPYESADSYETKQIEFDITKNKTTDINDYLKSKKQGLSYAESNLNDLNVLRKLTDQPEVKDFLQKYDEKLKIKDILPIEMSYNANAGGERFSFVSTAIEDGSQDPLCPKLFCLRILKTEKNPDNAKAEATRQLQRKNINIEDYYVVYR